MGHTLEREASGICSRESGETAAVGWLLGHPLDRVQS